MVNSLHILLTSDSVAGPGVTIGSQDIAHAGATALCGGVAKEPGRTPLTAEALRIV